MLPCKLENIMSDLNTVPERPLYMNTAQLQLLSVHAAPLCVDTVVL